MNAFCHNRRDFLGRQNLVGGPVAYLWVFAWESNFSNALLVVVGKTTADRFFGRGCHHCGFTLFTISRSPQRAAG